MQIREAVEADIPEIVSLLKKSLGESLMPKSERYWRWKHVENPFGVSPVLLADEGDTLVGVRAFMRWAWQKGDERLEAVRAVDTVTHPDFQGKGIFSKLTRAALDDCRQKGINLVFNTPNEKSLPGYLKLDWKKAGKLPVIVQPARPLSMVTGFLRHSFHTFEQTNDDSAHYYLHHPGLPSLLSAVHQQNKPFITAHTAESLRWRYQQVPVARYYAAGVERNDQLMALLFYRIKPSRLGSELRITDMYLESKGVLREVRKVLQKKIKSHRADYATFGALRKSNPLNRIFSGTLRSMGPIVTIREIQNVDMNDFKSFSNWAPSLGDLELF